MYQKRWKTSSVQQSSLCFISTCRNEPPTLLLPYNAYGIAKQKHQQNWDNQMIGYPHKNTNHQLYLIFNNNINLLYIYIYILTTQNRLVVEIKYFPPHV